MKKENYILVLGASGNIGGKIAQELISRGETVGVVGRSKERLQQFEDRAEIWTGDFGDDTFLQKAFSKASTLFITIPDEHLSDPPAVAKRLGVLLQDSPVNHAVNISNSIVKRGGATTRLVLLEQELNKTKGINLKHLRSANFFENLNWGFSTPYRPDLQLPYISSYEVACVAANYLQRGDFEGVSVDVLLGERDYSMAELAAAAGTTYQQVPYTSENIYFYKPFNEGDFEVEARTLANTSAAKEARFTLEYFIRHDLRLTLQP